MSWTHRALLEDLADHLTKPERMVWCDMQLGPSGSPRPDVYTMAKSYSKPKPIAYEIKVSISDYRRDITAGKWQSYLQFAGGVMFCTPQGLVSKEDLPKGCGLMIRTETSWSTLKAPTLSPVTLPQDTMMKLVIDGLQRVKLSRRNSEFERHKTLKTIAERFGEDAAICINNLTKARERLTAMEGKISYQEQQAEQRAKWIIDRANAHHESEMKQADELRMELAKLLGLPDTAKAWQMHSAMRDIEKRLSADTLVQQCHLSVQQAQRALDEAAKMLPPQTS